MCINELEETETNIGQYGFGDEPPVKIGIRENRPVIIAYAEGEYAQLALDLINIIEWVKKNRPDLL